MILMVRFLFEMLLSRLFSVNDCLETKRFAKGTSFKNTSRDFD